MSYSDPNNIPQGVSYPTFDKPSQIKVEKQENFMEKIQKYGKIGIITHLAISWSILGGLYVGVGKTGQGPKLVKLLKLEKKIPAGAGTFAIASVIYKAIMPLRIALSLIAIPFVAEYFEIEINQGKGIVEHPVRSRENENFNYFNSTSQDRSRNQQNRR